GLGVRVFVRGRFVEEFADLSSPIQAMAKPMALRKGKTRARLAGSTWSFEGGPIKSVSWELLEDDESKVKIEVKARIRTEMADDYLIKVFDLIDAGRQVLSSEATP